MRRIVRRTRLETLDDAQLVERIGAGEDAAFAVITERHRPWLVSLCTRLLSGDAATAEDVVQETFVKAHAAIARGNPPERLHAWLAVVARHGCMDEHRRRRPEPTDTLPETGHLDDDPFALDPHLEQAWEALTVRHRDVLHHRELAGLSYNEIAVVMDCTVPAVETLLFRARAALRREYQRAGGAMLGCGLLGFNLMRSVDREVQLVGTHVTECAECHDAMTNLFAVGELLRGRPASEVAATVASRLDNTLPIPAGAPNGGGWLTRAAQRASNLTAQLGDLPTRVLDVGQGTLVAVAATALIGSGAVITAQSDPAPPPPTAPGATVDDEPSPAGAEASHTPSTTPHQPSTAPSPQDSWWAPPTSGQQSPWFTPPDPGDESEGDGQPWPWEPEPAPWGEPDPPGNTGEDWWDPHPQDPHDTPTEPSDGQDPRDTPTAPSDDGQGPDAPENGSSTDDATDERWPELLSHAP